MFRTNATSIARLFAPLLLLALCAPVACKPKDPPEKAASTEPAKAEPEKVETPPDLPPVPDLPVPVPPNCDVEVIGEHVVEKAIVTNKEGTTIANEIVDDGKTIRIVCPDDEAARQNLDIIAAVKGKEGSKPSENMVTWRDVNLGEGPEAKALDTAEATPGAPEEYAELVERELGAEYLPQDEPEKIAKVKVTFSAGTAVLAKIQIVDAKGAVLGGDLTLENKTKTKKLAPGTYTLKVQSPFNTPWKDFGKLTIEPGETSVTVTLKEEGGFTKK